MITPDCRGPHHARFFFVGHPPTHPLLPANFSAPLAFIYATQLETLPGFLFIP